MSAPSRVLCLNNGSSSLKLAFYDGETRLASITVEEIGSDRGRITTSDNARRILESEAPGTFADTQAALRAAFSALDAAKLHPPDAVGHRVVHAGPHYAAPERVTTALVAALRALTPFAPLHLLAAIVGIEAVTGRFHGVPAGRLLRHCVPPPHAGGVPAPAPPAYALGEGRAALRLPRSVLRVGRGDGRRGDARPRRHRASRQRREHGRRTRRSPRRYDDGIHTDRRLHDGHTKRRPSSALARSDPLSLAKNDPPTPGVGARQRCPAPNTVEHVPAINSAPRPHCLKWLSRHWKAVQQPFLPYPAEHRVMNGRGDVRHHGRVKLGGPLLESKPGSILASVEDPGILVHLLAHEGYDVAALERLVDQEAGLLGVSAITADMKTLLALRGREPAAPEVIELFCHQLRKNIARLPRSSARSIRSSSRAESASMPRRSAGMSAPGSSTSASASIASGMRDTIPSSASREARARFASSRPTKT